MSGNERKPSPIISLARKNHKGVALIFVIAISGVISLIIGIMMSQYILQNYSIKSSIEKIQSFYTAEAGIAKAFDTLASSINVRTGDMVQDVPIEEKVFYQRDDAVAISIFDDCGFARIKSRAKGRFPKTLEVVAAGIIPDSLRYNLYLYNDKPLIVATGGELREGRFKLKQPPQTRGGHIETQPQIDQFLAWPLIIERSFQISVATFRYLLSMPKNFEAELFSRQIFSPENPFSVKKVFVNDAILIENRNFDSLWYAGSDLIIASTAEVQVSGATKMNNVVITAIGAVKILDEADLRSSRIYSETSIELRDDARFTGVLIAPEVIIADRARIGNPSIIYGGLFKISRMFFNSESLVSCSIINPSEEKGSIIEIAKSAQIEGFIYAKAPITHNGKIRGYVICRGFYDEPVTEDTTNTNVLHGIIESPDSTVNDPIPLVFERTNEFKIIQWREF